MEPSIYIVDDDTHAIALVRRALEHLKLPLHVFTTAEGFLRSVDSGIRGCALLDLQLSGMDGLELQQSLRTAGITVPVIFVSGKGNIESAVRAMKQNAVDFIEKPFKPENLVALVNKALTLDQQQFQSDQRKRQVNQAASHLTPRERQVMDLVAQGLANKQVAHHLGLSEKTIEVHRAHVMKKMNADSLAELVKMTTQLDPLKAVRDTVVG